MFRNYHIEQVATGFTFSERHVVPLVRSAIEITFPSVCLSVRRELWVYRLAEDIVAESIHATW